MVSQLENLNQLRNKIMTVIIMKRDEVRRFQHVISIASKPPETILKCKCNAFQETVILDNMFIIKLEVIPD